MRDPPAVNDARSPTAARLLTADAIREHCGEIATWVEAGHSPHFAWNAERLGAAAAYVAEVIRERYPSLDVPYHSRWRHFEAGGIDRWAGLAQRCGLSGEPMREERARVRIDLVIPSVLLDAGAGAEWRYREPGTGGALSRSEGLAVASLALFASGALSSDPARPLSSDAAALSRVGPDTIAAPFQVAPDNRLVGIEGRAALLARLGAVIATEPAVFGSPARLGNLFDALLERSSGGRIEASELLGILLRLLGPVWPGRLVLDGVPLGDCWAHPAATGGLVPFHKLTQWLTYSLLEPLEEAGLAIGGLDALTGLPEYRNGGLLLDLGVLEARDATFHTRELRVDEPAVVEWRAMTVVGLDRMAPLVRTLLGVDAKAFPLARMLEGGTWAAGRKIAAARRAGGAPPVRIVSDGTVF
jgi:hypothetical protein